MKGLDSSLAKTPVTVLQEYLLAHQESATYSLIYNGVGTHEPVFKYEVLAAGRKAVGTGKSKKEAKHEAARLILESLISEGKDFADLKDVNSILSPDIEMVTDNAVGALQEYCIVNFLPSPSYELTRNEGLPHAKYFCIMCTVSSFSETAKAGTKKKAKRLAAHYMLTRLQECFSDISSQVQINCRSKFEELSAKAMEMLQNKFSRSMGTSALHLGINIAEYFKMFKQDSFPKSSTLNQIKGMDESSLANRGNPLELLSIIADDLNVKIKWDKLESCEANETAIVLTLCTTPAWSVMGWGSSYQHATLVASIQALYFLATMSF